MSYYSRVTFEFSDEPPAIDNVANIARSWLSEQNLYAVDDVVEDLRRGWSEGHTDFCDLVSQDIEGLMMHLSTKYPGRRFYVRGMGEEFHDVWLRQFESGRVVFRMGPFEADKE
jgi:hypothetical protein